MSTEVAPGPSHAYPNLPRGPQDVELQPFGAELGPDPVSREAEDGLDPPQPDLDDDALVALQLQLQIYMEAGQQDRLDPALLQRAQTGDREALAQAVQEMSEPRHRRRHGIRAVPIPLNHNNNSNENENENENGGNGGNARPNRVNEELQNVLNRRSIFDAKPLILLLIVYGLIELGFSLATLFVSVNKSCDRPLRFFVLAFSLRQAILIPINIRRFLDPNGFIQVQDVQRRAWVQIFWLVCFIIGHLWVYSSETCRDTDPITYWWSFILIIIVYIDLCFPVLLLLLLCTCWPCVAYTLRRMQPNPGASDEQIRGLPVRRFDPDEMRKRQQEIRRARKAASLAQNIVRSEQTSPSISKSGNGSALSTDKGVNTQPLLQQGDLADYPVEVDGHGVEAKSSGGVEKAPPAMEAPTTGHTDQGMLTIPIHEEAEDDELTCSICLQEFQRGDQLICLPCSHDFHKKCCESWLKLHSTCPLCRKDINQR